MKKNEIYEGMVTELKFPNKGRVMVENEEETVMVKNTLPGQKVRFRLAKNKKNKNNNAASAPITVPSVPPDAA